MCIIFCIMFSIKKFSMIRIHLTHAPIYFCTELQKWVKMVERSYKLALDLENNITRTLENNVI